MFSFFIRVSYDSVVPFGWVGLAWFEIFKFHLGFVWLGQPTRWAGLDLSHKI